MAATTATNLQVLTPIVGTYAPVFFDEVFSLRTSGVVNYDTDPGFPSDGTNTYTQRGLYYATAAAQTPVAATDLDIRALGSNTQIGVIRRRGDAFGLERLAARAGGINEEAFASQVALTMANGATYDVESAMLGSVVPGVFAVGGTLDPTNVVDHSGVKFDVTFFTEALAKSGERAPTFNRVLMHSTVYWKNRLNELLTTQPNSTITQVQDAAQYATTYAGSIGNLAIFLNDRMYNSAGVYITLVGGSGSSAPLYLGVEQDMMVDYEWKPRTAGGTHVWSYTHSHSPAVAGVSFTGTAPTDIAGVTDAALALSTNWTKVTGHTPAQTPAVAIHSLAE